MIRSGGVLVKSRLWSPLDWNGIPQPGITPAYRWGSYDAIYRAHLWPFVLVNKIANATARLPLKVYERDQDNGRNVVEDHPYARLLSNPHPTIDPYTFWLWVASTLNVYGEAFLLKRRNPTTGFPVALLPRHPTRLSIEDGSFVYLNADGSKDVLPRRNVVHFKYYDPGSDARGMSPLEPLRWTLENEEGSRLANTAHWRNGSRPSVLLKHPGQLSEAAQQRLKANWESVHAGADNFSKTAVLEEGMEAQTLTFNPDEMAYISTRQLNREEVCAAYDVPPPVVHILDRATFSNITEQMRSMYRDTMAPKLKLIESTLELEVRDGRMGAGGDPEFGEEVYAEFLMDEVLRGSFEARATAYQQADYMTVAEKRRLENLPFIEGTDRVFMNAANQPLEAAEQVDPLSARVGAPALVQSQLLTINEARADYGLPPVPGGDRFMTPEEIQALRGQPSEGEGGGQPQLVAASFHPRVANPEDDPVVKRHIAGIRKRMAELGAPDGT